MTTQELLTEGYQESGEPSDLCPFTTQGDPSTFDITTVGAVALLKKLNQAIIRIANWKFRDGRNLRLRGMYSRTYLRDLGPITGTAVSGLVGSITVPGLATNENDQYNSWTIEITSGTGSGQIRTIVDTVVSGANLVLTPHVNFDTAPDNTSVYSIYKNFFKMLSSTSGYPYLAYHLLLDPVASLQDVLRIRDIDSGTDLERTYKNDILSSSVRQKGVPTTYLIYGNEIFFDSANEEANTYEIIYLRNPTILSATTDVPDIPAQYHPVVKLWMVHDIQRMNQNFNGAYATKREIEDLMEMSRLQGDFEGEYDQAGVVPI